MAEFELNTPLKCPITERTIVITQILSVEPGMTCAIASSLKELRCEHMDNCDKYAKGNHECLVFIQETL